MASRSRFLGRLVFFYQRGIEPQKEQKGTKGFWGDWFFYQRGIELQKEQKGTKGFWGDWFFYQRGIEPQKEQKGTKGHLKTFCAFCGSKTQVLKAEGLFPPIAETALHIFILRLSIHQSTNNQ